MLAFPKGIVEAKIKACFREFTKNALAQERWFENLSAPRSDSSLKNTQFQQ